MSKESPMSDQLYELLAGEEKTAGIPWVKAAEHFVMLKLASGAPLPEELDAIKLAAAMQPEPEPELEKEAQDYPSHREQIAALMRQRAREQLRGEVREAKKKGILSGLRSSVSQDITHASRVRRKRGENIGKVLGALGGAGAGILAAKKGKVDPLKASAIAGLLGYTTGKTVGGEIDRRRVKARYRPKKASIEKTSAEKKPVDGESTEIPVQDGVGTSPLDEFLSAQQEANELEFFRQQAEEAQAQAQDATERADMAEQQVQQVDQERQVEQQNMAAQQEQSQQQTMMAQQQSQMAQQDAVQARDESLAAQQANIALRQTITAYRQALMNLIAQDPTQQVPPAPVPQGPMPGMQEGGAPPGAPPAEAAPPEGAPAEGAPPAGGAPPEQAAAPPGPPPAPPAAAGPGGMGGAPGGAPPAMKPPGGAQGGPPKPPSPAGPPAA
jgi:hypothetical protein